MKIFIDTANIEEIRDASTLGVIDGVTTNPSLIAKEGKKLEDVIGEICSLVDGPISGEIKATTTKWEDMVEWLKAAYGEATDEFSINVHGVMFDPYSEELKLRDDIDMKYLGIACYAFVGAKKAHDKELEKQARAKMYKDSVKDDWFGNVGDKFEKELMFEKIIGFDGYYGYTYFLFFRDEEGRVFKWSSSNGSYKCWSSVSGNDGYCDYEVGKKYQNGDGTEAMDLFYQEAKRRKKYDFLEKFASW